MIEKLLLLSCRSPFLDNDLVYPALANLYLKSFVNLHRPQVEVTVKDDYDLKHLEWVDDYDAIGISIMTPQRQEAIKLLRAIKKRNKNKVVIGGGPHIKHYIEDTLSEPFDFLVPLDGEKALIQIIDGTNERIIRSTMSKQEILEAPRPDRTSPNAMLLLSKYNYNLGNRKSTTMMTARGCPELCTFCEDARTPVRWSSLDNIRKELDDIKSLGYGGVYIFDDLFALAKTKVEPICRELKARDLIYRCNGQARYFTQDPSFAVMLKETGCYEIAFGAESGSQKILDTIKKRTTVEQNYEFVRLCKENGIICKAFLMIGLPGETYRTITETEWFIRDSGIQDFQLSIYYPYKGTAIRDAIDRGDVSQDLFFEGEGLGAYGQRNGSSEAVVRTNILSRDDLVRERDRIVAKYKPYSHRNLLGENVADHFFDTHLKVSE